MSSIKKTISIFVMAFIGACFITACGSMADLKSLVKVGEKASHVPGVISARGSISTFSAGGKKTTSYVIIAQVNELPSGQLAINEMVRAIADTVLMNEPKIDSFDYLRITLAVQHDAVIFHTSNSTAIAKTSAEWRLLLAPLPVDTTIKANTL